MNKSIYRKTVILLAVFALCIVTAGCSESTMSISLSGDSAVVETTDDGARRLLTDEADVQKLTDAFALDYEEVSSFDEAQADYIIYIGSDLDTKLKDPEKYIPVMVLGNTAYLIQGDTVYKSVDEVDLTVLSEYCKDK